MKVAALRRAYRRGKRRPTEVVEEVYDRIKAANTSAWIATREKADVLTDAEALTDDEQPLYGIPFAVKDNIDYAGLPTTAGCPAYATDPDAHATVVKRLLEAGALLIGKTNMDQFATGLVGTRSPHGACRNVYNREYISGGSSSGSAVAVARGQVAFALGTDTAGSGRVPAAFNGLIGLKPTRGVLSTNGVVPACASLDCVSVFARSMTDARLVENVAAGFDASDPYSRQEAMELDVTRRSVTDVKIGIPAEDELAFFGDREAEQLFEEAVEAVETCFSEPEIVDFTPFREAAELLYDGPWVAERLAAVGEFLKANPETVNPVVADIIARGEDYSARETFEAFHRLETLRQRAETVMNGLDALVVPTAGTVYTVAAVQAKPIELNATLGYYTNFVNLLDLTAVSVPTGRFNAGPTFSVSVVGEAFTDATVTTIGAGLRDQAGVPAP